jgi:hypothetical protein
MLTIKNIFFTLLSVAVLPSGTWLSAEQSAPHHNNYQQWKDRYLKESQKTPFATNIVQLIHVVESSLHQSSNLATLHCYNLVRELLGEPLATAESDIDTKWLKEVGDTAVMFELSERNNAGTINAIIDNLINLSNMVFTAVDEQYTMNASSEKKLSPTLLKKIKEDIVGIYNQLRSTLKLLPAKSYDDIDRSWLEYIRNEIHIYSPLVVSTGFKEATRAQKVLAHRAQQHCGLSNLPVITKEVVDADIYGASGKSLLQRIKYIILGQNPDLDLLLFTLYHELAHVLHNDSDMYEETILHQMLADDNLYHDIEKIDHYIEVGIKAFDATTRLGKRINERVHEYTAAKVSADHTVAQARTENPTFFIAHCEEMRADLFALEKLFELCAIDTIIANMYWYATERNCITPLPNDPHPADFERALYTAGFLVEHGIDITTHVKRWESKGQCIDFEQTYGSLNYNDESHTSETNGGQTFLAAYKLWHQQQAVNDYAPFKFGYIFSQEI